MTDKDYENEDFEDDEEFEEDDEELEDDEEEEEETEESESESKEETPKPNEVKSKQSQSKNEFYKNLRLKEKEESKIREDERRKTLLDSVNHINPYTEKPIVDEEDEEEYFTMREIEAKGKNPIEDYSSYLKEKNRQKREATKQTFDTKADVEDFKKDYPNVDIRELMADKDFIDIFGEELGKVPLKTLYKAYDKTKTKVKSVKKETLKKKRDKGNVGSASSSVTPSVKDVAKLDLNSNEFEELLARARRGDLKSEN